jgi:uncharacterized membrane protein
MTGAKGLVRDDVRYLLDHPYVALFAVGGLLTLFAFRSRRRDDVATSFVRGAVLGAAVLVALAPNYTGMRLELPFVPIAAFGVALGLEWALVRARVLARGARVDERCGRVL